MTYNNSITRTMDKITLVLSLSILLNTAFAQKGKVISALNYKETGKLKQAVETIQTAIDPNNEKSAKSIHWPRTWEVRGEIYQAVFQSEDKKIKSLSTHPLTEALNSYKKALELDTKNKFSNSLKINFTLLNNDFQNQGVQAYSDENYAKALDSFEKIIQINNLPLFKTDDSPNIDTAIIYNAGLMALKTGNFDKAIGYYREAAQYGYNGSQSYLWLSKAYEEKKDTLGALESLKLGFEKYPADDEFLRNMIQVYINMNRNKEALQYLEMAIRREPDNSTYHLALGSLFDKNQDKKEAIKSYQKAIELDSTLFMAYFNLGVIYYNKGITQFENTYNIPANDNETYNNEIRKAEIYWEKSLPYMEKCYQLKPDDPTIIESLKNLYYRLKKMEKYNAL